jgi:hypothetical protein
MAGITSPRVNVATTFRSMGRPNRRESRFIGVDRRHVRRATSAPGSLWGHFTCKRTVGNLVPGTVYYYRFVASTGDMSIVGRVRTAPKASKRDRVHFAFNGDYDGLIRPYALASVLPSQTLDFYVETMMMKLPFGCARSTAGFAEVR